MRTDKKQSNEYLLCKNDLIHASICTNLIS